FRPLRKGRSGTPVRPEKGRQPAGRASNDHAGQLVSSKRYTHPQPGEPGCPAPSPPLVRKRPTVVPSPSSPRGGMSTRSGDRVGAARKGRTAIRQPSPPGRFRDLPPRDGEGERRPAALSQPPPQRLSSPHAPVLRRNHRSVLRRQPPAPAPGPHGRAGPRRLAGPARGRAPERIPARGQ